MGTQEPCNGPLRFGSGHFLPLRLIKFQSELHVIKQINFLLLVRE